MSKSVSLLNSITLWGHHVHAEGAVHCAGGFKTVKVGFVKLLTLTSLLPLHAHYNTITSQWQEDAECQHWIMDGLV